MITIQYFGHLKDTLSTHQETLPWSEGTTEDLIHFLRQRDQLWNETLAPEKIFKIAINNEIAHSSLPIPQNADVAILPPVTGG